MAGHERRAQRPLRALLLVGLTVAGWRCRRFGRQDHEPQQLRARPEEILATARRHGARTLRVFGSVARGNADAESDIDFLVELEPGRSLLNQGALLMDLQEQLGCRVDVMTEAGLRPGVRARVLQEAVVL